MSRTGNDIAACAVELANAVLGSNVDILAGYDGDDIYAVDNGADLVFETALGTTPF